MKMKYQKLEKLLYKSFDTELNEEEQKSLQRALSEFPELRKTENEVRLIRNSLKGITTDNLKPFFEERLMNRLSSNTESAFSLMMDNLTSSFRKVALTAIVVLMFLIAYNINAGNYSGISELFGTSDSQIEYALDPTIQFFME